MREAWEMPTDTKAGNKVLPALDKAGLTAALVDVRWHKP
jgi:hypothetical protein